MRAAAMERSFSGILGPVGMVISATTDIGLWNQWAQPSNPGRASATLILAARGSGKISLSNGSTSGPTCAIANAPRWVGFSWTPTWGAAVTLAPRSSVEIVKDFSSNGGMLAYTGVGGTVSVSRGFLIARAMTPTECLGVLARLATALGEAPPMSL